MRREVELGEREVTVVGTSHVSQDSVDEVEETIDEKDPDVVGVELDQDRYNALKGNSEWKDLDMAEAIAKGKGFLMFLRVFLSIFQKRAGAVEPGSEMKKAVEKAEAESRRVALVDRDINETFRRARELLSFTEKIRLFLPAFDAAERFDPEELSDYDAVDRVVRELGDSFPGLSTAFLDERNAYMAEKILEEEFDSAVLVVGAAHLEGVADELEQPSGALESAEKPFPWFKIFKCGLPAFIVAGISYSFLKLGTQAGIEASAVWIGINGALAMLGAIASFSHPLTWLVSLVAAPLTSLDPALGAGMVAAYAEAKLRPPSVEDLEDVSKLDRYSELWGNQAGRVLLTFVLVSIGSAAATFISAGYIAALIG